MTFGFAGFSRSLLADIQTFIGEMSDLERLSGCCDVADIDAHVYLAVVV